jgi:hypothetical protein
MDAMLVEPTVLSLVGYWALTLVEPTVVQKDISWDSSWVGLSVRPEADEKGVNSAGSTA